MIRPIVLIPDPILRQRTKVVVKFDECLADFVTDLIDSMHAADGVGLAAPQLGSTRRLFVIDFNFKSENLAHTKVYINPILLGAHGIQMGEESCLSIPNVKMHIARPQHIIIRAQDINGQSFEESQESFAARVWCHEFDHCNGTLITDLKNEDVPETGLKF